MKLILWSSISPNFIGGDYLFTKTLVSDGKYPGSPDVEDVPAIFLFALHAFFCGMYYDNSPAHQNFIFCDTQTEGN